MFVGNVDLNVADVMTPSVFGQRLFDDAGEAEEAQCFVSLRNNMNSFGVL